MKASSDVLTNIILEKTACFTGHRPHKLGGYGEDNPTQSYVKEQLRTAIISLLHRGYDTFISGMAQGTDLWAAQVVLELKTLDPNIKLVAAMPFEGFASAWSLGAQELLNTVLSKADDVL